MVCLNFILQEFCKLFLSLCSIQFAQLIVPYPLVTGKLGFRQIKDDFLYRQILCQLVNGSLFLPLKVDLS